MFIIIDFPVRLNPSVIIFIRQIEFFFFGYIYFKENQDHYLISHFCFKDLLFDVCIDPLFISNLILFACLNILNLIDVIQIIDSINHYANLLYFSKSFQNSIFLYYRF